MIDLENESQTQLLNFADLEGFTPHMARLVHMLEYVRWLTLVEVKGLTTEQLDIQVLPNGNTIGMLLAHIAGIEKSYQIATFAQEDAPSDLPELMLGEMGRLQFKEKALDFYLDRLSCVRTETLERLKERDDVWLDHTYEFEGSPSWNNYFGWFHVLEDEIRHQGQIAILRKEIERRENEVKRDNARSVLDLLRGDFDFSNMPEDDWLERDRTPLPPSTLFEDDE